VVKEFDCEIVKTRFQKNPSTKSMVIRITDREILEQSGGIIHGMSGSPILQDGKIVGALTHVVLGDASRGYGIYIDFVLP
jgi:stage IV sporulation protein B